MQRSPDSTDAGDSARERQTADLWAAAPDTDLSVADPDTTDPADRTRLAWSRTAIAFASIGAGIMKFSPLAGGLVLVISLPIWAVAHGVHRAAPAPLASTAAQRLVTATVLVVALAALAVALIR